jgi:hypothetical protein
MKKYIDFLKYLKEVKFFSFPKLSIYNDGSGYVSVDIDDINSDIELFDFNSLEELDQFIENYDLS